MKIKITERAEEHLAHYDYRQFYRIDINGKEEFSVSDGEPEDANLSRDFNSVYSITDLMKMAYEAGKAGEEFELEFATDKY